MKKAEVVAGVLLQLANLLEDLGVVVLRSAHAVRQEVGYFDKLTLLAQLHVIG